MNDKHEYDSKTKSNSIPIYKKTTSCHSLELSLDQDSSESTNDITCIGSLDRYFNIMSTKKRNLSNNNLSKTAPSDTYISYSQNIDKDNTKDSTKDKIKKYKRRSKDSNIFIME